MVQDKKKLPIGIENFNEIRTEDFYYIDKTGLVKELLHSWGKVNLFTRPRRFGKTLNMSMLRSFFEIGRDGSLFEGLKIAGEKSLCDQYMGQFPVIFISLKSVDAPTFESAVKKMGRIIQEEAIRLQFLLQSEQLTEFDRKPLMPLFENEISLEDQQGSLMLLSKLLYKHYGKKVILLIDEYDVPLDKAYDNGYYEAMVSHIRSLFSQALKTNDFLHFAVLTGCLRISKESIFTGLNNLKVLTITDVRFDEYFGFTDDEVKELLSYYDLMGKYDLVKEWYDGYHFGNVDVYCPWDVINYCDRLLTEPDAEPEAYWANASSNSIVKHFIQEAKKPTQREIEQLIAGESIRKEIRQELTYNELLDSIDNLWSVLFTTGYLTQEESLGSNIYRLAIPNREVHEIFVKQIKERFDKVVKEDRHKLNGFCAAFKNGEAEKVQELFNSYLIKTISIRDTYVKKVMKENFYHDKTYHGILLGLLGSEEDWVVLSNAETGEGFGDILVEIEEEGIGCVAEIKYAEQGELEAACNAALKQIESVDYTARLRETGMQTIYIYGIACYKKRCKVVCRKRNKALHTLNGL